MPPKAQPGEGIVVVLDVGPGVRASTETSFFSQAKKCLTNILQRKMFAEKCKDQVGVVLFGTDGTDNNLASGDQYQHITVLREIMTVDWDMMNEVDQVPFGKARADWLDALVVAMDLMHDPDGMRYSSKKIVLMTDFSGEFSDDQASKIIAGLNNSGIELSVIGPEIVDEDNSDDDDMDGPGSSNGAPKSGNPMNWNGKPKSAIQLAGEALITRIVSEVDGIICSFDEAIPQLIFFQKKSAGSANWNTVLDIGPDFQIAITGKIKVKHSTVPTWKKMHAHDETAAIISETSYHRHDDAQTAVDEAEVIMGYKYGTTLVPFSDEDAQMKFSSDSPRALSVLGFTRSSNVCHNRRAGDQVLVVTAREGDETAAVALSSLIQALVELDMVAITRRIYNKNSNPVMGVLFPEVTKKYECLIWIPLPFQEDIRLFTFPSLQRLTEKLAEKEKQAMDDLISCMDLSGHDDDEEELEPTTVLNPQLQHYYNVLTHRAIHPHDPLPPPADHVLNILKPPESLCEGRDRVAPALQTAFPTKRVVKKTKDKADLFSSDSHADKKIKLGDDDNVNAGDLTRPLVTKVTSTTPVQDFMALLAGEAPNFNLICSQLGDVVMQLLDSIGGGGATSAAVTTKILDCLENFRRESCGIDPAVYNKFITSMKDTVTTRSLNEFWSRVKEGNYGLISSNENMRSTVSAEEAEAFWQVEVEMQAPPPKPEASDDMEDLLDDL
ncbi:X-ray repair cross-complementing protein 5-like [Penaeus chinensis]|uniref:X-ray repair cross-complementing protein 5-like n=1 Tax=Penaeus chinensis TaxID=139456 RepID=UPI001FB5768C|nr:X-ray repair cross-complementing protein 5-like [Penaeus chinensis]